MKYRGFRDAGRTHFYNALDVKNKNVRTGGKKAQRAAERRNKANAIDNVAEGVEQQILPADFEIKLDSNNRVIFQETEQTSERRGKENNV